MLVFIHDCLHVLHPFPALNTFFSETRICPIIRVDPMAGQALTVGGGAPGGGDREPAAIRGRGSGRCLPESS